MLSDTTVARIADVTAFLQHEARLLDDRRLDDWFELFTEDATYWLPIGPDGDEHDSVSLVYDDHRRLYERVLRLNSGFAYSQSPPSSTLHFITNVTTEEESEDETVVGSNVLIAEVRRMTQEIYCARVVHRLVADGDSYRIRLKRVELLNSAEALPNITFLF